MKRRIGIVEGCDAQEVSDNAAFAINEIEARGGVVLSYEHTVTPETKHNREWHYLALTYDERPSEGRQPDLVTLTFTRTQIPVLSDVLYEALNSPSATREERHLYARFRGEIKAQLAAQTEGGDE